MPTQTNALVVGARVHHRGCEWSYGFTEDECRARPNWGWGTVLQAIPQRDGSVEYEVEKDAPVLDGGPTRSWWASYHIDEARVGTTVDRPAGGHGRRRA